jgi:NitT/TauT family transport system permease protein
MRKMLLHQAIAIAVVLGIWEMLVRAEVWDSVLMPAPSQIGAYLRGAFSDGTLLDATWVTVVRLVTGFAVGVVLGLPTGFLVAYSPFAASTIGVVALGLQALPSVCWIPLALLWFGQTELAVLFVVAMGTLWSVVIAVSDGIKTIPPIYERAARTMGASGIALLVKVVAPASFPVVLTGMKQGWAFAWRSLLAAEIFVTIISGLGLGQLLHYGRELHAMDQVFGVMGVIVTVGLIIDVLLFGSLQRIVARRWGLARA